MKKNYCLKRIFIGVSIGLILMLIRKNVFATSCTYGAVQSWYYTSDNTIVNSGDTPLSIPYRTKTLGVKTTSSNIGNNLFTYDLQFKYTFYSVNNSYLNPTLDITYIYGNTAININNSCDSRIINRYIPNSNPELLGNTEVIVHVVCNYQGNQSTADRINVTVYTGLTQTTSGSMSLERISRCLLIDPTDTEQIISAIDGNQASINGNTDERSIEIQQHIQELEEQIQNEFQNSNRAANEYKREINGNIQDLRDEIAQNQEESQESQQVCETYDMEDIKTDRKYLNSNGIESDSGSWGITEYINIYGSTITPLNQESRNAYTCFYTKSKTLITGSCINQANNIVGTPITIPTNAEYMRYSIRKEVNIPIYKMCKNGNQAISDIMTDTTTPSNGDISSYFGIYSNSMPTNANVSNLFLLPIYLANGILNALNTNDCSSFYIGDILGYHFSFPCIDLEDYIGETYWGIFDIILSSVLLYQISKRIVKAFTNFTTLKEGDLLA